MPEVVLIPVLPPTAASTIPSNEVGIEMKSIPLNHVAATKPARSVVAPPPMATIKSERVNLDWPNLFQHFSTTLMFFALSAFGTFSSVTLKPKEVMCFFTFLAIFST